MDEKNISRLKIYVEELNLLSRLCSNFNYHSEVDTQELGPLSKKFISIAGGLRDISDDFYVESDSLRLLGLLMANLRPGWCFDGGLEGITFFLDSILHGLRLGGRAANLDPAEGFLTNVDSWLAIRREEEPATDTDPMRPLANEDRIPDRCPDLDALEM